MPPIPPSKRSFWRWLCQNGSAGFQTIIWLQKKGSIKIGTTLFSQLWKMERGEACLCLPLQTCSNVRNRRVLYSFVGGMESVGKFCWVLALGSWHECLRCRRDLFGVVLLGYSVWPRTSEVGVYFGCWMWFLKWIGKGRNKNVLLLYEESS